MENKSRFVAVKAVAELELAMKAARATAEKTDSDDDWAAWRAAETAHRKAVAGERLAAQRAAKAKSAPRWYGSGEAAAAGSWEEPD